MNHPNAGKSIRFDAQIFTILSDVAQAIQIKPEEAFDIKQEAVSKVIELANKTNYKGELQPFFSVIDKLEIVDLCDSDYDDDSSYDFEDSSYY